jgi:hypothetical protein
MERGLGGAFVFRGAKSVRKVFVLAVGEAADPPAMSRGTYWRAGGLAGRVFG